MADYIKTRKEILTLFYNKFSGDTLQNISRERVANALEEILLDGVKFKKATIGFPPMLRAALKSTIKGVLSHDLYLKTQIYKGRNPVNKLVQLWKDKSEYADIKMYIADNFFYGLISYDVGRDIKQETLESIIHDILLDGVKFKHATRELTPLMRAALKEAIRSVLSHEIYSHDGTEIGDAPLPLIIQFWKAQR